LYIKSRFIWKTCHTYSNRHCTNEGFTLFNLNMS
jgi:hypothetical protein